MNAGMDITNNRKKKRKLSVGAKILIAIVIVLYVIAMALIGFFAWFKAAKETAPEHDYSDDPIESFAVVTDEEGVQHKVNLVTNEESYTFLVLGRDKMAFLTDVMMLVNIDTADNSVTVMQLPRDTYIAGGYPTSKLNAVFSTLYSRYLNSSGGTREEAERFALNEFKKLISQSLYVHIDYAAIMNLEGFKNIVDILGGVDIEVKSAMYYSDPDQGLYINIPAGWQHLNGAQAEGFVRFRSGYATADLGREDAQKQFMFALLSKLKGTLSIMELPRLTQLAKEVFANLISDISINDAVFFANCLAGVDTSRITMFTVPGNMSGGYCVINKKATVDRIFKYFYSDVQSKTNKDIAGEEVVYQMFDKNRIFDNGYGVYDADGYLFGEEYSSGDEINIPRNGY